MGRTTLGRGLPEPKGTEKFLKIPVVSFEVLNIYPLSVPDCLPSRVVDRSELTVLGLEV